MSNHSTTVSVTHDHLTFVYDDRTRKLSEIQEFLESWAVEKLKVSIHERTYVVLGGDGLFVHMAKIAHQEQVDILGINFGTKGFLLHDRDVFEQDAFEFEPQEYPILHVDVQIDDDHIHGHAFNEVYLTRAGDASSVSLELSHRNKKIANYRGDGIMVSTPAGSTGWSRSYGGVILPHDANLNVLTPVGGFSPHDFHSVPLPDKGRIRVANDTSREAPMDILVDNHRIVSMESRSMQILIERASHGVNILIEKSYRERWDNKPYLEQWFQNHKNP